MINATRRLLIRLGKALPFVLCFILLIHYTECLYSAITNSLLAYDDFTILNTPFSFYIGSYFEYNIQTLFVVVVISIAIKTCIWNKLACAYLGVNLLEKAYFASVDIYIEYVYMVAVANIIVSALLVYKGVKLVTR